MNGAFKTNGSSEMDGVRLRKPQSVVVVSDMEYPMPIRERHTDGAADHDEAEADVSQAVQLAKSYTSKDGVRKPLYFNSRGRR